MSRQLPALRPGMPTAILPLLVLTALAFGCAAYPERVVELDEARNLVAEVNRDPLASQVGAEHLRDAERELKAADALFADKDDVAEVQHRAYLARRHAEVAREQMEATRVREQIKKSEVTRTELQLQARTTEVQQTEAVAAALAEQLAGLQAQQTERGLVLTLGDVLFDTGRATLKPGAADTLDRLAAFLQANADRRVLIEGHTDSQGGDDYNLGLSERRADAVRTALVGRGIPGNRVAATGVGEGYPVATNDTAAGRQLNRRVEIIVSDETGDFPGSALRSGSPAAAGR